MQQHSTAQFLTLLKLSKKLTCAEIPPIKRSSNKNKTKLKTFSKTKILKHKLNSPTSNKTLALLEGHGAQGGNVMILGTLSNDDGNAKDNTQKKMNLYFAVEFHK